MRLRRSLTLFFLILKLIFILPGLALRYYFERRGALIRFEEELVASGLPPHVAGEIVRDYPFKLRDIVKLGRDLSNN